MMWITWALLAALFEAFTVLFRKQATTDQANFRHIPILIIIFSLPLTTALGIYSYHTQPQTLSLELFLLLLINSLLNGVALWSRYRAIKHGDISRIEPLTMLAPAMLLISSWLMLREFPPVSGLAGVLLVSIGAVAVNMASNGVGLMDPIRALLQNSANRYMLLTVFIWSITTNIDKLATQHISTLVYVWWIHLGILAVLYLMLRPKLIDLRELTKNRGKYILGAGILGSLSLIFQVLAVQTVFVTYAIALRRLDILLILFLGHRVLKESNLKYRIAGTLIMIAGVFLIVRVV